MISDLSGLRGSKGHPAGVIGGADAPFFDLKHTRSQIFAYRMCWYNRQRHHSALGYLSPEQYEQLQLWTH